MASGMMLQRDAVGSMRAEEWLLPRCYAKSLRLTGWLVSMTSLLLRGRVRNGA